MEEKAPAPSPWREAGLHAVAWATCAALLWAYLGLGEVDWRYPIAMSADADGVYYAFQAKVLLETGWVYGHPGLGAPFGMTLYDFPHFDAMHLLVMKVIGWLVADWAVVLNVYFLLTFPLACSSALALFRHLGFRAPLALGLALLFAFQPHHFERGQGHLMLASYYHLPLLAFALVWLLQPQGLRDAEGLPLTRSRRLWLACGLGLLGAFGGHYYAAFACLGYVAAGVFASARSRSWAPLGQAALPVLAVAVGFALNLAPNAAYWAREGMNREASAKRPAHSEHYGLRVTQMLMPVRGHRVEALAELQEYHRGETALWSDEQSPIGLVAGLGLLALLAVGLFRPWGEGGMAPGLGAVALACVLAATAGGFGTLFAYLVTPQFHGLGRIVIFLALLGLIGVGLGWTWLEGRGGPAWAWGLAAVALTGVGLYDTLPARDVQPHRARFAEKRAFAEAIQAAVPAGAAVYDLPTERFPFGHFSRLIPFLYTRGLRWTQPAMIGRRGEAWHEAMEGQTAEAFLADLAALDIHGLILAGGPGRAALVADCRRVLLAAGLRPIEGPGGDQFFDLRPYAAEVLAGVSAEEKARQREAALRPVVAHWCEGVRGLERDVRHPDWREWRWSRRQSVVLRLRNYTSAPRAVTVSLRLFAGAEPAGGYTLTGAVLPGGRVRVGEGEPLTLTVTVPPGAHEVMVGRDGGAARETPDGELWFRVEGFRVSEGRREAVAGR